MYVSAGVWYGTCEKSCQNRCEEASYTYIGCNCRPQEIGLIYFGEDGCNQNCPIGHNPRECACEPASDCGGICDLTYCKPDEACGVDAYGNSVCQFNAGCPQCTSANCGNQFTNDGGTVYYCIYSGGWKWSTTWPDGFARASPS